MVDFEWEIGIVLHYTGRGVCKSWHKCGLSGWLFKSCATVTEEGAIVIGWCSC